MHLACCRRRQERSAFVGLVDVDAGLVQRIDGISPGEAQSTGLLGLIAGDVDVASLPRQDPPIPLTDVILLAPLPRPPRNIFCVGKNYREHAAEFERSGYDATGGGEVPDRPVVFTKPPSSVIGDGEAILPHKALTSELDYEAELAVIIGRGGRGIPAERAMDHVWGYTVINDVTARDLQRSHRQWFLGKALDTFCPMGPWAVTADDFDLAGAVVTARVNGEQRQKANVTDLIFDIPTLIETLAAGITLEPGDVIATGTPAGVGIGFDPPRFLRPGDLVEVAVTGIGTLSNRIAAS
jgi:2-keto-4-pentenoate hydratase/2-oxohepta-3-ene-1,7-dioic acid hydratase in catechol pathway